MASLGYGFYPTRPGKVLEDELKVGDIPQREFANSIGVGYSVLNEILDGRRSLSTTIALMFGTVLGIPVESLMELQLKYNVQTAGTDKTLAGKLEEIARTIALL